MPQAAIAGYTNAGKSTLLNRLTGADVTGRRPAVRDPRPHRAAAEAAGRPPRARVSDTVGFVSKLPHDLVEAFRSTLEEVTLAELVVHVADAASPDLDEQIDAVRRVLERDRRGRRSPRCWCSTRSTGCSGSERARLARRYPGLGARLGAHGRRYRRPAEALERAAAASTRRGRAARALRSRGPHRAAVPRGRGAVDDGTTASRHRRACPRRAAGAGRRAGVRACASGGRGLTEAGCRIAAQPWGAPCATAPRRPTRPR